ncbi:GNAT family N-acetyltransferase [Candidatus Dojkabacteria bacterium]|jgi:GNAT superfamily N-acetyltransferase|nr:GNAT family N-acetyltransferase [Candidatus Dojkabacteria bacterium]
MVRKLELHADLKTFNNGYEFLNFLIDGENVGEIKFERFEDSFEMFGFMFHAEEKFFKIFPYHKIINLSILFIEEKFRNKGIATTLMTKFLELFNKTEEFKKYEIIYLEVDPYIDNISEKDLTNFYKKFGFEEKVFFKEELFNRIMIYKRK